MFFLFYCFIRLKEEIICQGRRSWICQICQWLLVTPLDLGPQKNQKLQNQWKARWQRRWKKSVTVVWRSDHGVYSLLKFEICGRKLSVWTSPNAYDTKFDVVYLSPIPTHHQQQHQTRLLLLFRLFILNLISLNKIKTYNLTDKEIK